MKGPLFYSKILLFGEYGIIKDSKGLSIPYNFYNGALKVDENPTEEAQKSNASLGRFADYLTQLQQDQPELVTFNIEALKADVARGMYFDSSIPQGYGVGSSGALVAAIYDKYANDKITVLENLTREKLLQLKTIFGQMESFFHGKSSGLDPLNSYLSIPILINSKDNIEATGIPSQSATGKGAVFLLDSGIVGETAPMVNIFMEKLKEGRVSMLSPKYNNGEQITLDDIMDAIHKEDVLAIEIIENIGNELGKAISGLINLFNPELIVLGGTLSKAKDYLLLPIKSPVNKYSLILVSKDTKIKVSKLGDKCGIIGACMLVRSKTLGLL